MGSRVTGLATPCSDLALVVVADHPVALWSLIQLREAFDEASLPFTVGIIGWASAFEGVRQLIDEQA